MIIKRKRHKVAQNTEDWLNLRQGKFTASTFKALMSDKNTATYKNEVYRVAFEIATGESPESFSNEFMDRGHELEPFARKEYELQKFNDIEDGGFFELNKYVGASPDGLVGKDGLVEIKCPKYSTMITYILNGKLPTEYKWQVQGQLYVTGRKWCDFMGYHPKLKSIIVRVEPDPEMIELLETELEIAIATVESILPKIK
jgi:putative phage-type endonuclease